jgi:hypothetical protein
MTMVCKRGEDNVPPALPRLGRASPRPGHGPHPRARPAHLRAWPTYLCTSPGHPRRPGGTPAPPRTGRRRGTGSPPCPAGPPAPVPRALGRTQRGRCTGGRDPATPRARARKRPGRVRGAERVRRGSSAAATPGGGAGTPCAQRCRPPWPCAAPARGPEAAAAGREERAACARPGCCAAHLRRLPAAPHTRRAARAGAGGRGAVSAPRPLQTPAHPWTPLPPGSPRLSIWDHNRCLRNKAQIWATHVRSPAPREG